MQLRDLLLTSKIISSLICLNLFIRHKFDKNDLHLTSRNRMKSPVYNFVERFFVVFFLNCLRLRCCLMFQTDMKLYLCLLLTPCHHEETNRTVAQAVFTPIRLLLLIHTSRFCHSGSKVPLWLCIYYAPFPNMALMICCWDNA